MASKQLAPVIIAGIWAFGYLGLRDYRVIKRTLDEAELNSDDGVVGSS
jgi:hypothetical protein